MLLDYLAEVEVDGAWLFLQPTHQIRIADADSRHRSWPIAAEERLRRLDLGVVGDAHEEDLGHLMGDPYLDRAGASAAFTVPAAVLPVL
jgi:hypothetical protein